MFLNRHKMKAKRRDDPSLFKIKHGVAYRHKCINFDTIRSVAQSFWGWTQKKWDRTSLKIVLDNKGRSSAISVIVAKSFWRKRAQ